MIHQNKEDCHFRTFLDASLANNRELVLCIINTHSVSLAFLFRFKAGNLCILMSSFISKWDIRKSTLSLHQLIKDYCGHFSEHFGWRRLREASRDCWFLFFFSSEICPWTESGRKFWKCGSSKLTFHSDAPKQFISLTDSLMRGGQKMIYGLALL